MFLDDSLHSCHRKRSSSVSPNNRTSHDVNVDQYSPSSYSPPELLNFLVSSSSPSVESVHAKALATKCPCPSYPLKSTEVTSMYTWDIMLEKHKLANKQMDDDKLGDTIHCDGTTQYNDRDTISKRTQRTSHCPPKVTTERRGSTVKSGHLTDHSNTDFYPKMFGSQSDQLQIDIRAMENESEVNYFRKTRGTSSRDMSSSDTSPRDMSSREISPHDLSPREDNANSSKGSNHLKPRAYTSAASSISTNTSSVNDRQQRERFFDEDKQRHTRDSPMDYSIPINRSREVLARDIRKSSRDLSPHDLSIPSLEASLCDMSKSSRDQSRSPRDVSPREMISSNISPREYNICRTSPNERPCQNTGPLDYFHNDQRGTTQTYEHPETRIIRHAQTKEGETGMLHREDDERTHAEFSNKSIGITHNKDSEHTPYKYNQSNEENGSGRSSHVTNRNRHRNNSKSSSQDRKGQSAHRHSLPHEQRLWTCINSTKVRNNAGNHLVINNEKRIRKRSTSDSDFYQSPGAGYRRRLPQQPNITTKDNGESQSKGRF